MSGLEVAGVVLGALPLIISALEHYANGINTAKRFWSYKSHVRSLLCQINTERGIFVNTLDQLLTGIVRIDQMAYFIASVGGETWQEAGIEQKLKERLHDAYHVYLENVKGMEEALQAIMEKLALDPDGKVRRYVVLSSMAELGCIFNRTPAKLMKVSRCSDRQGAQIALFVSVRFAARSSLAKAPSLSLMSSCSGGALLTNDSLNLRTQMYSSRSSRGCSSASDNRNIPSNSAH
jgi:hypothetical protein